MAETSTVNAMLKCRCPRCHQGGMFSYSTYNLRKFDLMPELCPVCSLRFDRELGFYWGAMYFSYFLCVFIVALTGISLNYLANDPATWVYLTVSISSIILFAPALFRYSRMLMLYLFGGVSYDPEFPKQ